MRQELMRIMKEGNQKENIIYGKEVVEIQKDEGRVQVEI